MTIIRRALHPVNKSVPVNPWLFGGVSALVAWFVLTFVVQAAVGAVHALLGVGLVALVVWWGKRDTPAAGGTR